MSTIRRILAYLRPYLPLATGALVGSLIVTAANLYTPQLLRSLIDNGITAQSWNGILWATGGLLGVAVVRGIFSFVQTFGSEKVSQDVAYDIRGNVFQKIETLSFSYHDQNQTGQLMTRATSDVEAMRGFFSQGLLQLVSALITFVGAMVILFLMDWRLALASLATIPAIGVILGFLFARLAPRFREVQQKLGDLNTVLQENIAGVRVVKAFAAEPYEAGRYRQRNESLYQEFLGVIDLFSLGFPTVFLLANIGTLIVIWYGGNRVIANDISLGTLIAFNTYLTFLLFPIFQLGFVSQLLSRATASGDRLFEVLDAPNDVEEKPDAVPLGHGYSANGASAKGDDHVRGRVEFRDVHFRYIGAEEDVLKGVSFEVDPGATVAILGATGSGKSTIINLIPRFYDVTEGAVLIDGQDVRDVQTDSLRHQIGIVLQEVNLIGGTIRENIAFGRPDATQAEIEEAARLAQAHDFISAMPDGYDTLIGERGVGLSGGQKQRVAIARALLIDPAILIFDDSTSAVDADTEYKLQQALESLLAERTAFIIAQRISTVRNADLILVLEDGRVADSGTHAELLETSALYAEILDSQLEADERVAA